MYNGWIIAESSHNG